MANTYSSLFYHIVFSTKHRKHWIKPDIEQRIWQYIGGIAQTHAMTALQVGGMPDHVHLLFALSRTLAMSKVVEEVKKGSSKWAKEHVHPAFYWQSGYGIFAVSADEVPAVREYIATQEEHHRTRTFQDEYRDLLRRNGKEWDERYVWD